MRQWDFFHAKTLARFPQKVKTIHGNSMSAGIANLNIDQGAGYSVTFTYLQPDGTTPVNVTGWTAKLEICPVIGALPMLTVGTVTGEIVVTGASGIFALTLTAAQTDLLTVNGVYDALVTPPSAQPIRLVQGRVTVNLAVTT